MFTSIEYGEPNYHGKMCRGPNMFNLSTPITSFVDVIVLAFTSICHKLIISTVCIFIVQTAELSSIDRSIVFLDRFIVTHYRMQHLVTPNLCSTSEPPSS